MNNFFALHKRTQAWEFCWLRILNSMLLLLENKFWGILALFLNFECMCFKNCTFLDILPKVKTNRFADSYHSPWESRWNSKEVLGTYYFASTEMSSPEVKRRDKKKKEWDCALLMIYFYLSPGWFSSNKCKTCLHRCVVLHTDKKENKIFLIYKEIQMGSGESYIWGRASQYRRICKNISPYMRRSLVIYDFAPEPSEFPNIWGKFYFLFYQFTCPHSYKHTPVHKVWLWSWTTNACLLSFFAVGKDNSQICYDILHCWSYLQNYGFKILRGQMIVKCNGRLI
jgi:hypothetical protein